MKWISPAGLNAHDHAPSQSAAGRSAASRSARPAALVHRSGPGRFRQNGTIDPALPEAAGYQVDQPEEILAVTFTRKAAAEMRGRIIRAIDGSDADDALPRSVELAQAVATRNRNRGWQLELHPARMRISTIDAVNAGLAASSPLAAGTACLSEIAENPMALYQETARRVLAHISDQQSVGPSIQRLLLHLDNRAERVERLLSEMLGKRDQWLPLDRQWRPVSGNTLGAGELPGAADRTRIAGDSR